MPPRAESMRKSIIVSLKSRYALNPNPNISRPLTLPLHKASIPTQNPSPTTPPPPPFQPITNPSMSPSPPLPSTAFRSFSTTTNHRLRGNHPAAAPAIDPNQLTTFTEQIMANHSDMESKLDHMSPRLTPATVAAVIGTLTGHRVPALRFFNWVAKAIPPSPEVYNLMIDNLGIVDDYATMLIMFNHLSKARLCLTERAFHFLTARPPSGRRESLRRVTEALNLAGGSSRSSGIYSLIKVLCGMNCYGDADFAMEETARRTSYYNVFIAAKCRNGDFEGARDVLDEMRRFGCDPNTQSYNYLLGSLFKDKRVAEACELMRAMEELGCLPDSVTFEVVAYNACRESRMDFAIEFVDKMLADGVKPRLTMHAAFVKGYFWCGRAEDAYKYVADMSMKDKCSANNNYSLLASLFRRSGRVLDAGRVLHEMMERGLRPNFPVYMKIAKDLHKIKRGDLSLELKSMFSKFK